MLGLLVTLTLLLLLERFLIRLQFTLSLAARGERIDRGSAIPSSKVPLGHGELRARNVKKLRTQGEWSSYTHVATLKLITAVLAVVFFVGCRWCR